MDDNILNGNRPLSEDTNPADLGSSDDIKGGDMPQDEVDRFPEVKFDDNGNVKSITIFKPEAMPMQQWERKVIRVTRGFSGLGVRVRRVSK